MPFSCCFQWKCSTLWIGYGSGVRVGAYWFRSTGWRLLVQEYGLVPTGSGVRVGAYWFRSTGWCLLVQKYGLVPTGSGVRVGAYWFRSTGWCLLQCRSGRTMDGRQTNIGNHHTSGQQKHVLTWKTEAAELYHHENHLYSCFCDSVSLVAVAAPHSPTHYQWAARKRITQCSTKSHRVYLLTRLENLLDPSGREWCLCQASISIFGHVVNGWMNGQTAWEHNASACQSGLAEAQNHRRLCCMMSGINVNSKGELEK